ncbi:MAG: hypothetical protein ACP5QY_05725, partial [Candidatus Hydrogenedens sp.]
MPKRKTDFAINDYNLIQTRKDWEKTLKVISIESKMAIDLEANSLYEYPGEICLIQISIRGYDFLLDPLAHFSFPELGELLADKNILKIFHASEYDLRLFWKQYKWQIVNLFDTMWAGKLLGCKQLGLVYLLKTFLNVQHDKKFQKSNWKHRPLSNQQLSYAYRDSHYLIPLAEILQKKLEEKDLWDEAQEIFNDFAKGIVIEEEEQKSIQFYKTFRSKHLPEKNLKVLQELFFFREELGQSLHILPNKLISNKCLLNISKRIPETLDELNNLITGIYSISNKIKKEELLEIILKTKNLNEPLYAPPIADNPKIKS